MEIRTGEGHGVARNAIYLLSGNIISTVLGVIFVIYVAIQLGLTQFGIYTLGNYFAGLFVILGDLGLSNYTTREIARDKNNAQDILNRVFCLRLVLSLLAFIVGINVLLYVDYGLLTEQLTMIILFTHIFFRSFLSFLFHIFEGFERMEFVTIAEAFRRGIDLVIGVWVLSQGYGLTFLILGLVLSDLIILTFTWILLYSSLPIRIQIVFSSIGWYETLVTSIPFGLLTVFLGVVNSIDTIMLGKIRGEDEVGLYGAVIRITSVLTIIPLMTATAMFPAISRLYDTSIDKARSIFLNLIRLMMFLGMPIAFGTTLIGSSLIVFVYDATYLPAALPLKIVIWSIGMVFLNLPMIMFLSSIERQKQATMIIGISAMSNIILNLVLIPKYGMVGAAITTVISQVIILILCYRRIIDFLEHLEWISYFTQAAIGCIGMSLVLWFLPTVHPGVLIFLGSISYLSIMILTGALNRQDWHHMIHLFNLNKLSS